MKLCILLPLPAELAEQFPEDAQRGVPHVTILHTEVDADPGVARAAVDEVLAETAPIDVQLAEVVEVLDGGDRPAAVLPIAPDSALRVLRLRLRGALTDAGIETPQTHEGYRPHATIRYLDGGEQPPTEGPRGRATCDRVEVRLDDQVDVVQLGSRDRDRLMALRFGADLQEEADRRLADVEGLPAGWVVGRPFRCAATGQIFDRWTGKRRGAPIELADLESVVAIIETGEDVGIDTQHDVETPGGAVLAAWVVDDGDHHSLAVLPAYGPRLARYVAERSGFIWSSPELVWTDVADARTGESVGSLKLHSLALTHDPAQAKRLLDRVRLESPTPPRGEGPDDPPEDAVEEIREMLAAIMQRLDSVEAEIAAMKSEQMGAEEPDESGEAEQPEGEEQMGDKPESERYSSLTAEVTRLRAQLAQTTTEKLAAERAGAVSALLSSGRIAPAEKEAAEAVYDKGGRELLDTVYGSRPENSAVPKLKGHGEDPTAASDWAKLHQEATALVTKHKDDPNYDYDMAVRELLSQRRP